MPDKDSSVIVCHYCQSNIKNAGEAYLCTRCGTPYHTECWYENNGCGVYGCGEKSKINYSAQENIQDIYVNIEYLINCRRYQEALMECKRILKADKQNIEAKKLYNKAVALINTKTRFIENGDLAFDNKDYKSAEAYYTGALNYTNEEDTGFIKSRISIVREKAPYEARRKTVNNYIVSVIIVLIVFSLAYMGYYFIILKQDREFAEIESKDNIGDMQVVEMQVSKYERFTKDYDKGSSRDKALEKISYLSGILAENYYKKDWRNALKYLNKIDSSKVTLLYNDLYGKIYTEAEKEYKTHFTTAKKLDAQRKFAEAQRQTEQAIDILSKFPGAEISKNEPVLQKNLDLLKKKLSTYLKYSSIEAEIKEKESQLNVLQGYGSSQEGTEFKIEIGERVNGNTVKGLNLATGKEIALNTEGSYFTEGEIVSLRCTYDGLISYYLNGSEIRLPLYKPLEIEKTPASLAGSYERESVRQRLDYLRSQKIKLDSILSQKL